MSYSYNKWPSRGFQQPPPPPPPQQGAVSHGSSEATHGRLPVSWPKAVGSHPTNLDQGVVQVSYPSILNAPSSLVRGTVIGPTTSYTTSNPSTNPSAATQLQPSAQAPRPLMAAMQLYRPVTPPSSPPRAPPYPMEACSNRVSPPPGFPAKQVSRSTNKEVPVTLRLNLPVPTARPTREMASPPPQPAAVPSFQPMEVSQARRSSTSPRNRCICQRAHCKVLCTMCKQASRGRVRLQCPRHPHTIHLMDYDCCPNCKAVNLTEVELRPN